MASEVIESSALTLRFKHGKYCVLLFAETSTPFTTIIEELLEALRDRYKDGIPMGKEQTITKIPKDISQVALAVPEDAYDPSKGWTELGLGGQFKETPASLKIKESSAIAFAFKENEDDEPEFWVETPDLDALYGEE